MGQRVHRQAQGRQLGERRGALEGTSFSAGQQDLPGPVSRPGDDGGYPILGN